MLGFASFQARTRCTSVITPIRTSQNVEVSTVHHGRGFLPWARHAVVPPHPEEGARTASLRCHAPSQAPVSKDDGGPAPHPSRRALRALLTLRDAPFGRSSPFETRPSGAPQGEG